MKDVIKGEKKTRPLFIMAFVIMAPLMMFLHFKALSEYSEAHKFKNTYYRTKEKVEYQVIKKEKNGEKCYFLLLNLKTKKKVVIKCKFEDYMTYDPGKKITYNLSKYDLEQRGEYKIPENNDLIFIYYLSILDFILTFTIINFLLDKAEEGTWEDFIVIISLVIYGIIIAFSDIIEMMLILIEMMLI